MRSALRLLAGDHRRSGFTDHEDGWRNHKHRQQWRNTLAAYVSPIFGESPVQEIDTALVMRAIEPLWRTRPETASRVRGPHRGGYRSLRRHNC